MKTLRRMLGIGKLLWVLFLIPYLGIWSIHGGKLCNEQLYIKRGSIYFVSPGDPFKLECPVTYCANRPNVTWCKFKGTHCSPLQDERQERTSWEEGKNISTFILYFEHVLASDNGSYRCIADILSGVVTSHSVTIYVTAQTQNNSEHLLINATSATGPPSQNEMVDRKWLLYGLLPLGALSSLLITCFCLFCCLRKRQEKRKKSFDPTGREIHMAAVPQPFGSEQTEAGTRQNSQTQPSETGIYDNDPWFRAQEGPEVYSNPCLEENKQNIVYASLNHSVTGKNPRPARDVKEAPTEYAAICVRS
ncbi:B- and T-lymphocyte attenuator [Trichechus manatus latirostris]|uniref:B- and T-lymphocyte attenuator n=1 Tax=Trichechus manatus latirostris TaxID=127582 RepID=A0A2Y9QRK4_TRIMA|nr:B- and T-lymphocyte attenuator [Trichechus manatus latirostris]